MLSASLFAQEEVPFTLEDRDRLIRLEAEQKALRNEMNARFGSIENEFGTKLESQQNQIDDLKIMFRWGFSIFHTTSNSFQTIKPFNSSSLLIVFPVIYQKDIHHP